MPTTLQDAENDRQHDIRPMRPREPWGFLTPEAFDTLRHGDGRDLYRTVQVLAQHFTNEGRSLQEFVSAVLDPKNKGGRWAQIRAKRRSYQAAEVELQRSWAKALRRPRREALDLSDVHERIEANARYIMSKIPIRRRPSALAVFNAVGHLAVKHRTVEPMAPIRTLQLQAGLSINAVRRALELLVEHRVLSRVPPRGRSIGGDCYRIRAAHLVPQSDTDSPHPTGGEYSVSHCGVDASKSSVNNPVDQSSASCRAPGAGEESVSLCGVGGAPPEPGEESDSNCEVEPFDHGRPSPANLDCWAHNDLGHNCLLIYNLLGSEVWRFTDLVKASGYRRQTVDDLLVRLVRADLIDATTTSDATEWVWRSPTDPATVAVTGAGAAARRARRVRLDRQARDALPRCEQQVGSGRCRMHAWPGDRFCKRHAVAGHMAAKRAREQAERDAAKLRELEPFITRCSEPDCTGSVPKDSAKRLCLTHLRQASRPVLDLVWNAS